MERIKSRYYRPDGTPKKCRHCEGRKIKVVVTEYVAEGVPGQESYICEECGTVLAHWAFGLFDPKYYSEEDFDPLEVDIENTVCLYARRKYNGLTPKYTSKNRRSVPDRIMLLDGVPAFFIEFKRKGENPTAAQAEEHKKLRDRGFIVYVIDNPRTGKEIIDTHVLLYKGRN